jgi:hypothetical protein
MRLISAFCTLKTDNQAPASARSPAHRHGRLSRQYLLVLENSILFFRYADRNMKAYFGA